MTLNKALTIAFVSDTQVAVLVYTSRFKKHSKQLAYNGMNLYNSLTMDPITVGHITFFQSQLLHENTIEHN